MTRATCLWCGRSFTARRGGSPQRFCRARCRTAFWSALRRWAERAVASGALTIDHIRNADPAACMLVPDDISSAPAPLGQKTAPQAASEERGLTAGLLDNLLIALFELPGDAYPDPHGRAR